MANNLDRLFRENLDQLEITPSAEGWSQVKAKIARRKSGWIIPVRIAAAIAMVLSATLAVIHLTKNGDHQEFIASVDHPSPAPSIRWELKVPDRRDEVTPDEINQNLMAKTRNTTNNEQQDVPAFKEIETLSVAGIHQPLLEMDLSTKSRRMVDGKLEVDQPSIKITYIASEQPAANDSTSIGKLSKVIAFAKDMASADLLADLRDAKDNLFKRN